MVLVSALNFGRSHGWLDASLSIRVLLTVLLKVPVSDSSCSCDTVMIPLSCRMRESTGVSSIFASWP